MLYATILTICTTITAPCNQYIVDTANSSKDAAINMTIQASDMKCVWNNDKMLQAHMAKFNIVEAVGDVQSYEVRNEIVEDEMIP